MGEEQGGSGMNAPPARTEYGGQRSSVATPSITIPKPKLPLPRTTTTSSTAPTTTTATDAAPSEWNTSKLGLRIGSDALSAGAAGVLVAPIITMIDKGIMENASGRAPLRLSLQQSAWELVSRPHVFLRSKPFALIFALYFGTYLTANTIDTAAATLNRKQQLTAQTSGSSKFVATSSANLALCLYKDNQFTRLFAAPGAPARAVPLPTFALFTVRDCLTIFASFNLPPLLAPHLEQRMSDNVAKYVGALSIAQFVTPAAVQVFSTPLHLLGLDLYNRPAAKVGGRDGRVARVVRDWGMSALARICRIVPAFGVGGVVNTKVRRALMGRLEEYK